MKSLYSKKVLSISIAFVTLFACKQSFLDRKPIGSMSEVTLQTKAGVNGILTGAYSMLDGAGTAGADVFSSINVLSTMSSDDAHPGSEGGATSSALYDGFYHDPTTAATNNRWRVYYSSIQRANDVLRVLPNVKDITEQEATQVKAEAMFLRGVYHLGAALLWRNIPIVDESITYDNGNFNVPNTLPVWPKIEADFQFAADNLTDTKAEVGRANKWAAKAFLVKVFLFQHKYAEAKPLLDDIIANGKTSNNLKYALLPSYSDNFKTAKKHGSEAVFAVQMSTYDGAGGANGNAADNNNGPYGSPATCCYGWLGPSFDLVNAYQTDPISGLPLLDSYSQNLVRNDQGLESSQPFTPYTGTLDSRLDWTVGRRGIPFLDWGVHPGKAWIRKQILSGPYSAIKNIPWQARKSTDTEGLGQNTPYNMIRFADVLLWAAETEAELGNLQRAESYVNMVRARAANPEGWVRTYLDTRNPSAGFSNTPAANYKVGLYTGQFTANGKDYALKAIYFERRLELALEHHRFFDLQRYDKGTGYMANVLNAHLRYEEKVPNFVNEFLAGTSFTKGKNEILPIPQIQIDLSVQDGAPTLKQNAGY